MNGGNLSLRDLLETPNGASDLDLVDISRELDSLGLELEPEPRGFAVRLVRKGSAAEHCGQVRRGDVLTEYNSVTVQISVQGAPVVRRHGVRNGKFVFLRVVKDDGSFVECAVERDPDIVPAIFVEPNSAVESAHRSVAPALPHNVATPPAWAAQRWRVDAGLRVDHTTRPPSAIEKSSPGIRSPVRSINKGLGKLRWKALGEDGVLPASPAVLTGKSSCGTSSARNQGVPACGSRIMGYAADSISGCGNEKANLT